MKSWICTGKFSFGILPQRALCDTLDSYICTLLLLEYLTCLLQLCLQHTYKMTLQHLQRSTTQSCFFLTYLTTFFYVKPPRCEKVFENLCLNHTGRFKLILWQEPGWDLVPEHSTYCHLRPFAIPKIPAWPVNMMHDLGSVYALTNRCRIWNTMRF